MGTLIVIGLLGGLITGISPCILPMLPVIFFAGGVQGARRPDADGAGGTGTAGTTTAVRTRRSLRPYIVIAGLVLSFSVFTLLGSLLLSVLGLPQDLLRWAGITLLVLLGIGMIVPRFETILERPFQRIAVFGAKRGAARQDRGAFALGLGLGVLYVPCAGPVLAAITVAGATGNIGVETVALTVSFAVGAAIPLLVFALAGRRIAERVQALQAATTAIRTAAASSSSCWPSASPSTSPRLIQRMLPDYTAALQQRSTPRRRCARRSTSAAWSPTRTRSWTTAPTARPSWRTAAPRRRSAASTSGSTRRTASRSSWRPCAARWCSSTSGPTPASTASGRSRT